MTLACFAGVTAVAAIALAAGKTGAQETFASPGDAANALVAALQTNNRPLFLSITGQEVDRLLGTGDPERDVVDRESFIQAAQTIRFEEVVDAQVMLLYPGNATEPFPAPLVRMGAGWCFDGESGLERATRRRIRRNELAAIQLCHRYVGAQMAYAALDHGSSGLAFAPRIRSTPGQHDGLYWPMKSGEDESPIGPLFAAAAFAEQQDGVQPVPYFGYFFKVLAAGDPEARGFALLAWPAEYSVSGLRSFLVSDLDQICQKDLGIDSARAAGSMTSFRCDDSWSRIEDFGRSK